MVNLFPHRDRYSNLAGTNKVGGATKFYSAFTDAFKFPGELGNCIDWANPPYTLIVEAIEHAD